MNIKENDVFNANYKKGFEKSQIELSWNLDCQLIARKDKDGDIVLFDSFGSAYYDFNDDGVYDFSFPSSKMFFVENALKRFDLTFKCNLSDIERINYGDRHYYNEGDVFDLSYHENLYCLFFIKKGVKKSKEKLLNAIDEKLKDAVEKIENLELDIEELKFEVKRLN